MSLEIPSSRVEEILKSKIDGTTYDKMPLSRVEALLIELNAGGGGTTDYDQLTNKPTLNGTTLEGSLTSKDVDVESDYDVNYSPEGETIVIHRSKPDPNNS